MQKGRAKRIQVRMIYSNPLPQNKSYDPVRFRYDLPY
jgi:hypothetical protein